MKRLSLALLILLLSCTIASADIVIHGPVGGGAPAAETCSGSGLTANESFEAGDPLFCTTSWTVTDTDGKVSTSDAAVHWCGTASLSVAADADAAADDYAELNFGAGDVDFYTRFYVKVPDVVDWTTLTFASFDTTTTPADQYCALVKAYDGSTGGTTVQLFIRGDADSANYFALTEGSWYRIEVHCVRSGTTGMKVWDSAGTPVLHDGAAAEATCTGSGYIPQYLHLFGVTSGAPAYTAYFDDAKVALAGADYIGAQSCIVGP